MILFWVTLLLLHQVYSLVPVTTVPLGEPATFTCASPGYELSGSRLFWYKQRAGDTLKLIVTLVTQSDPAYGPEFSASRIDVNVDKGMSKLTILRTIQEDEGMYHCGVIEWRKITWSGTYLSLNDPIILTQPQRTSNYTVVQRPTVSDSVRPGDLMTLQCSVLSDSENETCPGDHSVYWFKTGSDKSHPNIIYTGGNRHDECDKRSDIQKSCIYHFSKNVSSSDAGTYYCAVATCGEILFGDGTKVKIEETSFWSKEAKIVIFLLCAALAIIPVIAFLIYTIKKNNCDCCTAVDDQKSHQVGSLKRDEDRWVYSAVIFVMMKTDSGAIKDAEAAERERIYAAVKAFGLDQ